MRHICINIGLVLLTACSSMQPTETGFIDNYHQLKQVDERQLRFIAPPEQWRQFDSVKLMPVTISLAEERNRVMEDWSEQREIIQKIFTDTLAPFDSADSISPLEFKFTVSDIDTTSPILNVITTLALLFPLDNGGITIEAELVDSLNNQRLASWVWFEDRSMLDLFESYSTYGHAELAAKHFADEVKEILLQH